MFGAFIIHINAGREREREGVWALYDVLLYGTTVACRNCDMTIKLFSATRERDATRRGVSIYMRQSRVHTTHTQNDEHGRNGTVDTHASLWQAVGCVCVFVAASAAEALEALVALPHSDGSSGGAEDDSGIIIKRYGSNTLARRHFAFRISHFKIECYLLICYYLQHSSNQDGTNTAAGAHELTHSLAHHLRRCCCAISTATPSRALGSSTDGTWQFAERSLTVTHCASQFSCLLMPIWFHRVASCAATIASVMVVGYFDLRSTTTTTVWYGLLSTLHNTRWGISFTQTHKYPGQQQHRAHYVPISGVRKYSNMKWIMFTVQQITDATLLSSPIPFYLLVAHHHTSMWAHSLNAEHGRQQIFNRKTPRYRNRS